MRLKHIGLTAVFSVTAVAFSSDLLASDLFSSGATPPGWACTGVCGVLSGDAAASGDVTAAPGMSGVSPNYGYVTTGGVNSDPALYGAGGLGNANDGGVGASYIASFDSVTGFQLFFANDVPVTVDPISGLVVNPGNAPMYDQYAANIPANAVDPTFATADLNNAGYYSGATNGSVLTSTAFSVTAADIAAGIASGNGPAALEFAFNFVTSDGGPWADYAWAKLINNADQSSVLLFTARTNPDINGAVSPGVGLSATAATIHPANAKIIAGVHSTDTNSIDPTQPAIDGSGSFLAVENASPTWAPLGPNSNTLCYALGCGFTGWSLADYNIATAGSYTLQFGVTNWNDTVYDSGLAFDKLTLNGENIHFFVPPPPPPPPGTIPEPSVLALLGLGLAGFGFKRRHSAAI